MRKLSLTLATAVSVGALGYATTARGDDTASTTPSVETTTQPAPQPVQSVTVQPAPAPSPVATTTTTGAAYVPPPTDSYAESTTERRPNRALLSTGVGMFVISYGASVIAGAVSSADADRKLFVPVVGPWLDLGERSGLGDNEDLNKAMIITSGVVQGAGVLLALGSLVVPESTTTKSRRQTAKVEAKPEVHVTPVSFGAGAGVGAIGRF